MFARFLTVLSIGLLWSHAVLAVDGVIEINQAAATADGVTPGDTPGFPVTLSQPGSYRLTGPLSITSILGGTAIAITTSDVALDLNGFRVSTTSVVAGGHGVDALGRTNIRVRDGTIESFTGDGIRTDERARFKPLRE